MTLFTFITAYLRSPSEKQIYVNLRTCINLISEKKRHSPVNLLNLNGHIAKAYKPCTNNCSEMYINKMKMLFRAETYCTIIDF